MGELQSALKACKDFSKRLENTSRTKGSMDICEPLFKAFGGVKWSPGVSIFRLIWGQLL